MVTLKMLSDEEVTLIFGKLGRLLPLHEELLAKLEQARGDDGRTLAIGYVFVEWVSACFSVRDGDYCAISVDIPAMPEIFTRHECQRDLGLCVAS